MKGMIFMKKNTMKKIITMALAAITTMSVMSVNVGAVDSGTELTTVYTYNEETDSFDVSYAPAGTVKKKSRAAQNFQFSQYINSNFSYLLNINNNQSLTYLEDYEYMILSDTVLYLELDSYDTSNDYYFEFYQGNTKKISNAELVTPTCVFSNLEKGFSYSIKLKKNGAIYLTEGSLYS